MFRLKSVTLVSAVLFCSCNGASSDGRAQEEHRDNTDSIHTIAPSKSVQPASGSFVSEEDSSRTHKGTKADSMRTAADPLYKGHNSDTAITD